MSVTAFEPLVSARYIRAKIIQHAGLTARVGTRVYDSYADRSAATPYVVMTLINANDLMVIGAIRVWSNQLWQIEVWNRTNDTAVMGQDAALLDAALHNTSGTMTGVTSGNGTIWRMTRERSLSLPAEPDAANPDVVWRRAGGEYRLYTAGA